MTVLKLVLSTYILLISVSDVLAADPTQPFFSNESSLNAPKRQALVLQAIFVRKDYIEAVINGQKVREGDHILDVTIEKIESDKVSFSTLQNHGVLTLHKRLLKRVAAKE